MLRVTTSKSDRHFDSKHSLFNDLKADLENQGVTVREERGASWEEERPQLLEPMTSVCVASSPTESNSRARPSARCSQRPASTLSDTGFVSKNVQRRITSLNGMDPEVSRVVTFGEHKELLRGSRLCAVLRRGATILATGTGSAETYSLSEEVSEIDTFLSHNWAVSRVLKFFCLIMHFNLTSALLAAVAAFLCVAALAQTGFYLLRLETTVSSTDPSMGSMQHDISSTLLMTPVFLLVSCFGHELRMLLGFQGRTVFLDKTCIHQVDVQKQQAGIRKLGAFLRSSTQMVAIYSDVYLTKLWTVYEAACFLAMHPARNLTLAPTYQPVVIFGGVSAWYMKTLLLVFLGTQHRLASLSNIVLCTLFASVLSVILRRWAREQEGIKERLCRFRVEDCTCSCESDRPFVYYNIAVLMRAIDQVGMDATEEESLAAFNDVVRERLHMSFTASVGRFGLSYIQVAAIFICTELPRTVDVRSMATFPQPEEWNMRYRLCALMIGAICAFGLFPLFFAFLSVWCQRCLHLRRYQEKAFIACGVGLLGLNGSVIDVSLRRMAWVASLEGPYRDLFAALLGVILVMTTLLAMFTFSQGRRQRDDNREESVEEMWVDEKWEAPAVEDSELNMNEQSTVADAFGIGCSEATRRDSDPV